jgi:predicted nucleotidyltransferase
MPEHVLLRGIVGSTAYGLAGPGSDIDRLGVFAAPTVAFHGLHPPTGRAATVVTHDPDLTLHEAAKAAHLLLAGNPTVNELLWLPAELYEVRTPLGDELIGLRRAFLSARRCRDAYFGYATTQLRRLVDTGEFQSKMRSRKAKHGRHLLRLLDQGYALYTTGQLPIRVADPQRYLSFGEAVAADAEVARRALAEAERRFAAARTALPDEPDPAAVQAWLLRVRRAFLPPEAG